MNFVDWVLNIIGRTNDKRKEYRGEFVPECALDEELERERQEHMEVAMNAECRSLVGYSYDPTTGRYAKDRTTIPQVTVTIWPNNQEGCFSMEMMDVEFFPNYSGNTPTFVMTDDIAEEEKVHVNVYPK